MTLAADSLLRVAQSSSSVQQREGAVRTELSPDRDFYILQTTEKLQRRTIIYTALILKPVPSCVPFSSYLSIFSGFMPPSSNTPVKLSNFWLSHFKIQGSATGTNSQLPCGICGEFEVFSHFAFLWDKVSLPWAWVHLQRHHRAWDVLDEGNSLPMGTAV